MGEDRKDIRVWIGPGTAHRALPTALGSTGPFLWGFCLLDVRVGVDPRVPASTCHADRRGTVPLIAPAVGLHSPAAGQPLPQPACSFAVQLVASLHRWLWALAVAFAPVGSGKRDLAPSWPIQLPAATPSARWFVSRLCSVPFLLAAHALHRWQWLQCTAYLSNPPATGAGLALSARGTELRGEERRGGRDSALRPVGERLLSYQEVSTCSGQSEL